MNLNVTSRIHPCSTTVSLPLDEMVKNYNKCLSITLDNHAPIICKIITFRKNALWYDNTLLSVRHGRIGFGLMDKSQHSRSDNIIDDALFINIFHVTMLIHDSTSLSTFRFKYKFKL